MVARGGGGAKIILHKNYYAGIIINIYGGHSRITSASPLWTLSALTSRLPQQFVRITVFSGRIASHIRNLKQRIFLGNQLFMAFQLWFLTQGNN
jgi:hypothetical protein